MSAITLAIALYFVDFRKLVTALQQADYVLIGIAISFSLVWLLVRGTVWRTLLQDKASYKDVFFTLNEGYLLNNVLPFRLGEVARVFLLGGKAHLDFWYVFSTILLERALDVAYAAGLVLCTLPFLVGVSWARPAAIASGGIVLLGLALLYLLARNQSRVLQVFSRLSTRWTFLQRFGGNALAAFLDGLGVLTEGPRFLRVVALMTLNWGIAVAQYYVLMSAFSPQAKPLWAAFVLGVAALGIAAPSSPGAVGVFELTMVGALALFGVDPSVGFATAVTAHLLNYLFTSFIGAYALAKDGETLTGLYKSARGFLIKESQ